MKNPTKKYNPQTIEAKWQRHWSETGIHRTPDPHGKTTFYCLDFFPYPSGDGLSVGMKYLNEMTTCQNDGVTKELKEAVRTFTLLLAPFAPHIAEELWERLGGSYSVHQQAWPAWEEALIAEESVTLAVQLNSRVRDRLTIPAGTDEDRVKRMAIDCRGIRRHLNSRRISHIVYVPGRLVNVVTE